MLGTDSDLLRKRTESVEQSEEAKLREKYPGLNNKASALLQRRLSKNVKYFDSGDYNMAKTVPSPNARDTLTGQTIPTPENIPTLRYKQTFAPQKSFSGSDNTTPCSPIKPVCTSVLINSTQPTLSK
ncbi:Alpha-endosulfine [Paragonimus heterotremus]|uniref:Alpha-endosulfine n=1 Tax=Paragonimus heterotremus TaxID=100268 RepID=A0A8J4X157_9TREM|nr:Alpha-endosulfine [Paragonimus heterotremus]